MTLANPISVIVTKVICVRNIIYNVTSQQGVPMIESPLGERFPELGRAGRVAGEVLRGGGEGAAVEGEEGDVAQVQDRHLFSKACQ